MKDCPQTELESVWEHGEAVQRHLKEFLSFILDDHHSLTHYPRLPDWLKTHRLFFTQRLLSHDMLLEFALWHDLGKPFCHLVDEEGRRHFPDHHKVSHDVWLKMGGSQEIARLMELDMALHVMKSEGIEGFALLKEAPSLLITSLAEVYANAMTFGGYESDSFKMKLKKIDRRGKALLRAWMKKEAE